MGELEAKIEETAKSVAEVASVVQKADAAALSMTAKSKNESSTSLLKLVEEIDESVKDAKEEVAKTKIEVSSLAEGVDDKLKSWMDTEVQKLEKKLQLNDPKLTKAATLISRCREDAKRKDAEELIAVEATALRVIKYHQGKNKLSGAALFDDIDTDKHEQINEANLLAFFKRCDREPDETTEGDGKEAGAEEKTEKTLSPSEDELSRLFVTFDDDKQGFLTKDMFVTLIRRFMKVIKDTVITSELSVTESKTLRRLELGEVIEVLEPPTKEEGMEVLRGKCRAMTDDVEGWITFIGNQGNSFLEDGGNLFKVVKETILTTEFGLDGGGSTKKLKQGEIVKVLEWARKEEQSGLMRMKCKVKATGAVGWVTTVGNQGNVYMAVV